MGKIESLSLSPVCVHGARNMVSVSEIRIEKRVVWRVDGLTKILAGFSRNRAPPPPFPQVHHSNPNRGYGWPEFDQISHSPGGGGDGVRNMVHLSAVRIENRAFQGATDWAQFW